MHWVPHASIRPQDTISALAYQDNGLLACTSWDGNLSVSREGSSSTLSVGCSRPLFALAWSGPALWFGGAENRVSFADIASAHTIDKHALESAVLALTASPDFVVAATRTNFVLLDPRNAKPAAHFGTGGAALDLNGNFVCTTGHTNGFSSVYDVRNLSSAFYEHTMAAGGVRPLQAKWLDASTYAVADSESHVSVNFVHSPARSFVFQTNQVDAKLPRPIHALARGPGPSTVATGGGDGHVYIWDYAKRKLRTKIGFPLACTAISYTPSGDAMAIGLSNDEWSSTPAKYATPSKARVMVSTL